MSINSNSNSKFLYLCETNNRQNKHHNRRKRVVSQQEDGAVTGCYPVFVQPPPLNSSKFTESHAQQYKKSHISHEGRTQKCRKVWHMAWKKRNHLTTKFLLLLHKKYRYWYVDCKKQGEKKTKLINIDIQSIKLIQKPN